MRLSLRSPAPPQGGIPLKRARVGLNAHLLSQQDSYRKAGVSRYIQRLLEWLPQVDPSWDYVAFLSPGHMAPQGWEVRRSVWRTAFPPARVAWEFFGLPWQSKSAGLDLFHAPVNVIPPWPPCPTVVTIHDLSPFLFPELYRPSRRLYQQTQLRRSARQAAHIIADSEATRQDVIHILGAPPERVTAIPLGVEETLRPITDPKALAAFRQRHGLERPYILFVGTLEPRKNIPCLLEAFALLKARQNVSHALVLVGGKGWYYEALFERISKLGLGKDVYFAGYAADRDLPYWYSAAEAFVYPSLYEGFGLPPLEAMACGVPVIVSRASSLPEAVGEAGLLVEPDDPQALAEAISLLLEDADLRERLRRAGFERAAQLTWRRTAQRTAAIYLHILRENDVIEGKDENGC